MILGPNTVSHNTYYVSYWVEVATICSCV